MSAPTLACGPSTSWLTALPRSCSKAPIFDICTSAPSSEASMPGNVRRLDGMRQAGSGRSWCDTSAARPASAISGCSPCKPSSMTACSPASSIDFSTSSWAFSTSFSMRPGWMRPSWTRRLSVSRATSRRTGSKRRRSRLLAYRPPPGPRRSRSRWPGYCDPGGR